jgi:uncharacterized membrane protein YoaK (UPF0700 family)
MTIKGPGTAGRPEAADNDPVENPAAAPGPSPGRRRTAVWRQWFADPRHGPLPALLLVLTVNTGVVDAVSILRLGRVFVANMTGNVVFVGFAIAGAPGFSLVASLWALAGFIAGALAGGAASRRLGHNRGRLFASAAMAELVLLAATLVISVVAGSAMTGPQKDAIAAVAAVALGLQNAVVRALAVPDLTTTVLTMTLTGIAADKPGTGRWPVIVRRLLAVLSMLGGAIAGALLVIDLGTSAGLTLAVGLVALTAAGAAIASRAAQPWQAPAHS